MLERGRVAETWRSRRWDSFCLVTPNWSIKLPCAEYRGPDPDGYLPLAGPHLPTSNPGRLRSRGRICHCAAVLDGSSREEAARIGGMDRQTLRDRKAEDDYNSTQKMLWPFMASNMAGAKQGHRYYGGGRAKGQKNRATIEKERSRRDRRGRSGRRPRHPVLLKGTLIARDASRFDNRQELTHGLLRYFDEVGIALSPRQRLIMDQIDVLVKWRGRYPIPKKKSDWALRDGPDGPNTIPGSLSIDEREEIVALIQMLSEPFPPVV